MTLNFEDPDHQGHQVGPDDPEIAEAVARIDMMIGRLIQGLEKRGVFEDATITLSSHILPNKKLLVYISTAQSVQWRERTGVFNPI